MRIDFVITELNIGGAERCVTELACGLATRGHSTRLFSLGELPTGDQTQLLARLRSHQIPVESARASGVADSLRCMRQLRRWLREGNTDICQTFLHHANVMGAWAASRVPGVRVVGGIRVAEPKRVRTWIERKAARRLLHVVCVSEAVAQFAKTQLGVAEQRLSVIGNGVDVEQFATSPAQNLAQLDWPTDSQVVTFVGRLHPQKGLELLQQSIDQVVPPQSNRRLLIIGDGPLRMELERWAAPLGKDRVRLVGWQPEIARWLKASSVLVLPSHYEGMPNVVLEAFAAGLPVVCSRVEGSSELIPSDDQLQSFAPGDVAAMVHCIERLLADDTLRHELGKSNQQRARQDFSIDSMIDRYEVLYRDLCSR